MSVTTRTATAGIGVAGRRGDGIRSDAWVRFEAREEGGIELELQSRVEPYYGEAIREQVREVLGSLGVEHARVEVEDTGALPFVLEARLEAAVVAAGIRPTGDARPEPVSPTPPATSRRRLRRSRLYLPGDEPKFMISAGLYRPDAVILDLEDSVHPTAKPGARLLVRNALRCVDFKGAERMVRINQLPLGLEDLEALVPERPDLILIPKVESADQVRTVEAEIEESSRDDAARGNGSGPVEGQGDEADEPGPPWLMPILESALGIEHAFAIAMVSRRVVALTIGLEDYAADIGVPRSEDGVESAYARTRLVNAAKAAGLQAIDSVYGQVDDLEGLRRWGERSKALGFEGMGCLHPRQIEVIHEAFSPSVEELEKARRIVEAYRAAEAEGRGVVSLGAKMIDPPVVQQAIRVVERAESRGAVASGDEPPTGTEEDRS